MKEYKIKLADMDQAVKAATALARLGIEMEEVGAASTRPRVMPAPEQPMVGRAVYLDAVKSAVAATDGKMGSVEAHLRAAGHASERGKVHRALREIGAVMAGKLGRARWGLTKAQAEERVGSGKVEKPKRQRKAKGGAPRRHVERAPEAETGGEE